MYMIAPVSICWHKISLAMLGRGSLDKYLLQGIIPADPRFIPAKPQAASSMVIETANDHVQG